MSTRPSFLLNVGNQCACHLVWEKTHIYISTGTRFGIADVHAVNLSTQIDVGVGVGDVTLLVVRVYVDDIFEPAPGLYKQVDVANAVDSLVQADPLLRHDRAGHFGGPPEIRQGLVKVGERVLCVESREK